MAAAQYVPGGCGRARLTGNRPLFCVQRAHFSPVAVRGQCEVVKPGCRESTSMKCSQDPAAATCRPVVKPRVPIRRWPSARIVKNGAATRYKAFAEFLKVRAQRLETRWFLSRVGGISRQTGENPAARSACSCRTYRSRAGRSFRCQLSVGCRRYRDNKPRCRTLVIVGGLEVAIEADKVFKVYPRAWHRLPKQALTDTVSASMPAKPSGFIGQNGTIKILVGVLHPTRGEVGVDRTTDQPESRRHLGFLP